MDYLILTDDDISRGYFRGERSGEYICIFCAARYNEGEVYPVGDRLYTAAKAIETHIAAEHASVFDALISQGKKTTGLTDVQSRLMKCFYDGVPDKEAAAAMKISAATVRFQRYSLKEKARQAKVFLALYRLMETRREEPSMPEIHSGATMVDERYMVTPEEEKKILGSCFSSLDPLVLKVFPPKEKKKLVILRHIARLFEPGVRYAEKQVNGILEEVFEDYVTIRRYLIEYGFMDRMKDCSQYWLKV